MKHFTLLLSIFLSFNLIGQDKYNELKIDRLATQSENRTKASNNELKMNKTKAEVLFEELEKNPNSLSGKKQVKEQSSETIKDITGLTYGTGRSVSIPEEFAEPAKENGWNPNAMTYEDMEKEAQLYYREKYLRWIYIGVGIGALIGAFFFARKLLK